MFKSTEFATVGFQTNFEETSGYNKRWSVMSHQKDLRHKTGKKEKKGKGTWQICSVLDYLPLTKQAITLSLRISILHGI